MKNNTDSRGQIQTFKNKIESGLLGGAIGDALGAPVEMITQQQIFAKHGKVEDYLPIKDNMFFKKHTFESDKTGWVTDDTILTFALIKSYNELGKLDLADIFKKHQEEFEKFPYGFGGATRFGMDNIQAGVPIEQAGQKNAAGNGVVMKQFPLVAIAVAKNISDADMAEFIITYTKATHDSDTAVLASLVHHKFLTSLLKTEPDKLNKKALLHELIRFITPYESRFPNDDGKISTMLSLLSDCIIEKTGKLSLSDEEIIEIFGRGELDPNNPKDIFRSGYVIFTLGIVYALFLRDNDFEAIINAVNIGGDTDSYASILGGMLGAYQAITYPEKYIDGLQKKEEILADIKQFIVRLFEE